MIKQLMFKLSFVFLATFVAACGLVSAASPESIAVGEQLFVKKWSAKNPALGGDGLGPLFNGDSCLDCHFQGGVGGSGDARFNVKTLAIEDLKLTGPGNTMELAKDMLADFHPGFDNGMGSLVSAVALSSHGGTSKYQQLRDAILAKADVVFSDDGGPASANEVQRSLATPILYSDSVGKNTISFRARIFQRNTTPLFGTGLIDQIPNELLELTAKQQKSHPEISGRPATLRSGRYGRFGWRGNIASLADFVDNACAAEVGLETKRKLQPVDPTRRDYRNTAADISDQQIIAIRDFIATLPAPGRTRSSDSSSAQEVSRGEKLFHTIGCAVCHVPDMGPAKGIYSDLLLHDMGPKLMDYNGAEPYIIRAQTETKVGLHKQHNRVTGTVTATEIYGCFFHIKPTDIETSFTRQGASSGLPGSAGPGIGGTYGKNGLRQSPLNRRSSTTLAQQNNTELIYLNSKHFVSTDTTQSDRFGNLFGDFQKSTTGATRMDQYLRLTYQPTETTQEWRTTPLWGLRDSAPYMHDGRAETVLQAIVLHDGESAGTRDRFLALPLAGRQAVLAFLNTLVAPENAL